MYQFSYNDVVEDSSHAMRQHEREALDRVIALLRDGARLGVGSKPAIEGLYFLRRLWGIFTSDVGSCDNQLPDGLRKNILALAAWVNTEIDRVHAGETSDLTALIEINEIVRDGLR